VKYDVRRMYISLEKLCCGEIAEKKAPLQNIFYKKKKLQDMIGAFYASCSF
jgi:hypothetical protein